MFLLFLGLVCNYHRVRGGIFQPCQHTGAKMFWILSIQIFRFRVFSQGCSICPVPIYNSTIWIQTENLTIFALCFSTQSLTDTSPKYFTMHLLRLRTYSYVKTVNNFLFLNKGISNGCFQGLPAAILSSGVVHGNGHGPYAEATDASVYQIYNHRPLSHRL